MGYTAGNLELSILGNAQSALSAIDGAVKSLNSFSRAIKKIYNMPVYSATGKITTFFTRISASVDKISTTNIDKLTASAKALSSISKISAFDKFDWNKSAKGFEKLTTAITPFINKVREAELSLTALHGIMSKSNGKKIQGLLDTPESKQNNLQKSMFDTMNMAKTIYIARKLGTLVGKIAQSGADYAETLNLWQVAMKGFNEEASLFVNQMNEAYGVSEKTLMNAQATFKNMLGALGNITDEMAYALSESVTRMAIDYASLYNTSIEEAMTKFEAALAGQVRPIRTASGYDITETTLYQLYQQLGGTKTIRQLNQTEKRLLAIYAIFQQMDSSGALGDMRRTIDSFANQSRVMAENFEEAKAYLGIILTDSLSQLGVMQSINSLLAFTSEFLKGIVEVRGALKGEAKADPFEDVENSATSALEATKKLHSNLLSFDKIRVMSEGADSDNEDVAIDDALTNAMKNYNTNAELGVLHSREMARNWLETVGLIYNAETATYRADEGFLKLNDTLEILEGLFVGLLAVIGTKGILGAVGKLATKFPNLGATMKSVFSLKNLGIMALIGAIYYLYTTNEEFRASVEKLFGAIGQVINQILQSLTKILSSVGSALATLLDVAAPVLIWIVDATTAIITFLDKAGLIEPLLYGILVAIALFKIKSWSASLMGGAFAFKDLGIAIELATGELVKIMKVKVAEWANGVKTSLQQVNKSAVALTVGISALIFGISTLAGSWDDMSGLQRATTLVVSFVAAVIAAVAAVKMLHMDFVSAFGVGATVVGIGLAAGSALSTGINDFEKGGLPDKGTVFRAGEAGAEIVYNTPSGQSGVANVQQIAQASYSGTVRALSDWWKSARNDLPEFAEANPTGLYQVVTSEAGRRGDRWNKY